MVRPGDCTTRTWSLAAEPNGDGQLGTGNRTQATTPTAVLNLGGMATLAAAATHGLATALRTRTTTNAYDRLSELTGVAGPGQQPASYAYDPAGNRTSARQGSVTTAFSQDRADRLTAAGPSTATSDADGNLTGLSGNGISESFAYDQANRLVSATVNGVTTTDAYDGDGVRVGQTVNGTATTYVNDTNRACPSS